MAKGVLLIVCGPSGVGKTSLCDALLDRNEALQMSISYTTRPRRGNEVDGEAYHFIDDDRFEEMKQAGRFAEWAEVHGNFYGTSIEIIESAWTRGADLLFDIDYQGARQLQQRFPEEATAVLVAPPDLGVLERRLRGRGTDSDQVIAGRLDAARHELEQYEMFDYIIENGEFDRAVDVLESIYVAARHARHLRRDRVEAMLDDG